MEILCWKIPSPFHLVVLMPYVTEMYAYKISSVHVYEVQEFCCCVGFFLVNLPFSGRTSDVHLLCMM